MEDIRQYAKIGLVHHMLYPECTIDPDYHVRTLEKFVSRNDIETLDCCIPFGQDRRSKAIAALRHCGKEIVYAQHLFPVRKIPLATADPQEQGLIRLAIKDQIELAAAAGAVGFLFGSGSDVEEPLRSEAKRIFADFCRWLCSELKEHRMVAMLEPFDRTIDKKFLYGSTAESVELIESLKPEVDNLKIEMDMAHIPLMGESFEHAFRTVSPHLVRVHLGNCVIRDPSSPWYGDKHPPIGFEGGELDVPELAEVLRLVLEIGYLSRENPGALVFEIQPFPGWSVEETIRDNMDRLNQAWMSAQSGASASNG